MGEPNFFFKTMHWDEMEWNERNRLNTLLRGSDIKTNYVYDNLCR